MIYDRDDVVVVPFPFSERAAVKRRPALVLSNRAFNREGHTVMAMVTTKKIPSWPGDATIADYPSAGLKVSCLVRFKLFTLDNRLIVGKIGHLSGNDAERIASCLGGILSPQRQASPVSRDQRGKDGLAASEVNNEDDASHHQR